ncbi:Crp/Fnr family transcriptional regulator [Streptomyces carminius]|uniref:Crp/Fnr family transcriptional regulator n=1 Tax=Streptomyces carminius TaxID=2665496 RepID=A0A2M8M5P8_9ACTN|nr:Crp/Fnr family transcriptional regulator [Streptomyces carminius]PJE99530.1 Crp/Fnr family transcriptional regulator [Streptomyces carminius]
MVSEAASGTGAGVRRVAGGGWAAGTLLAELERTEAGPSGPARLALERAGTARVCARDELMYLSGAPGTFVVLLLDGFAKITTADAEGLPLLVDVRAPGDVVGETSAFDGGPRSATVTAAQQMLVRRISQEEWLRWVAGHPAAAPAVHRTLAHRHRTAIRRTRLVRGPVVARLARAVLDLVERYGTPGPDGLVVRPALTQAEWSGLVGARERRVHHALRELSEAGVITSGRRRITVRSVPGLREIADRDGEEEGAAVRPARVVRTAHPRPGVPDRVPRKIR